MTPPYNPPEREPKATARKREKKQEPGKASTEKPPAVEKTADEMLDEELRKNTAQTSTDRPAEVDLEQLFIDAHQATGAELLQQSGMAESTETFDTSRPSHALPGICAFCVALSQQSFRRFLAHF